MSKFAKTALFSVMNDTIDMKHETADIQPFGASPNSFRPCNLMLIGVEDDPTLGNKNYTLDVPNEEARRLLLSNLLKRNFWQQRKCWAVSYCVGGRNLKTPSAGSNPGLLFTVPMKLQAPFPFQQPTLSERSMHKKEGYYQCVAPSSLGSKERASPA